MPRTTITTDGRVVYRTALLPLFRAAAFARCIEANASRFTDVEIVPTEDATKAHVRFLPVSRDRQTAAWQGEYDARALRAEAEGGDYVFWKDEDKPTVWWVFNPASGETYECGAFECSCGDYQFRCKKAGLQCKHMHALDLHRTRPNFAADKSSAPAETREERRARIQAQIARDF